MSWKKGVVLVIILFFITVSSGVIYLYNIMPESLKENSQVKMYCSKKPFEVKVETAGYNIYLLNGKFFGSVKDGTVTTFNKLVKGVKGAAGRLTQNKNKSKEENNDDTENNNDLNNNADISNNNLDNSDEDNANVDNTDLNNNGSNIEDNNINNDNNDNNED